ncbi:MAG: T9SS type A sorting domain-containing protein [Bacteroidota bacterium]
MYNSAKSYHVQLARDSNFVSGIVLNDTTVTDTSRLVNGLANGTYYWWRVNAKDSANAVGPWSNVWHFGTGAVGYWPVTFQVNMKIQMLRGVFLPGSGGVVCVAGDFNGWGGVGYTDTLKDPNQDSIFTKTISLADTSFIHYKYVTSPTTGGHWENDQPTASGMREFRVPVGGGAIPVVYFNNDSTITTPNAPVLIAPVNGATNQPTTLTLRWNQSAGAAKYYLQVCSASDFSALVFDDSTLIDTSYHIGPTSYNTLAYNTTYYWRVGAGNSAGWSAFSTRFSFMTFPQVAITPPVVSFPSDPTASTSYRLFSFPGVTTTTIGSIISGTQQTDWRMFRDNGAASNYLVELSSDDYIGPGEGYWLLKKGNLSLAQVTIEMPPIAADRTYGIPLHSGWNIISNPFDRAVLWSDIIGQNGLDSATKAWTYVGNFVDTVTVLAPFRGYYFSNDTNLTSLGIPYPFWQNIAPVQPPRADWQVQIIFESDINKDPANYIGIVSSSKSGLLKYHSHKPRLMFDQGFLCFNRSEWDAKNSRFNADYRSSLGDGQAWDFEVSNPRKSGAKITFKNIEQIPAGNEVILVNQLNTTPFDVRLKNEYVYATVSERMPFKLIVGKKQFVENEIAKLLPDKFELMQNFPNPFNPTTSISFKVAREAQVRLAVYSVLGERIKILTDGLHSPAVYTVTWDGTSESGNRIASGMYLCRLVVNGKSIQTKKLLLVK